MATTHGTAQLAQTKNEGRPIQSARIVPSVDTSIAGYHVYVTDSRGNDGSLIGGENLSKKAAEQLARNVIGKNVVIW